MMNSEFTASGLAPFKATCVRSDVAGSYHLVVNGIRVGFSVEKGVSGWYLHRPNFSALQFCWFKTKKDVLTAVVVFLDGAGHRPWRDTITLCMTTGSSQIVKLDPRAYL